VRTYRTEIFIPSDRTVSLQLPDSLPPGWATITIQVDEPESSELEDDLDPDRQDIEWWDEFASEEPDTLTDSRHATLEP
jgi:hypothetical protein